MINDRPLTEGEVKDRIKENNQHEQARHRSWNDRQRSNGTPAHQSVVSHVNHPGVFHRQHQRGFSSFDRFNRIYYYPDVTEVVDLPVLPAGYDSINLNDDVYYYSDGQYYQRANEEFDSVPPPVGAVVGALPAEYVSVTIGGVEYATYNGVYYMNTAGGYEVADPPAGFEGVLIAAATDNPNAIVVSLPDPSTSGQFVDIPLTRSGDGFVGPQGEYYPEFPPIEQLREMYLA